MPMQHPKPGHAAARGALRYGIAQGWIQDETARSSMNIQEVADQVAHTRQTEVALQTRGCHGGPAQGTLVEPTGILLVQAADMVRGVIHVSHVRQARRQGTM